MKAIKTLKYALVIAAIFTVSACELVEEPQFDTTDCTGCNETQSGEIEE